MFPVPIPNLQTSPGGPVRMRRLLTGTTYSPGLDVASFIVFLSGATGGRATGTGTGGPGGCGYAESVFTRTQNIYQFTLGAGGANTGTAGGTTTFESMSITGSGGTSTATGGAGGVATGGQFNATGGTGGLGRTAATAALGGGGGAGTRAGNGGNGGAAPSSAMGGGGGGTGGNNAVGSTGGAAATAASPLAFSIPGVISNSFNPGQDTVDNFSGGGAHGGVGFNLRSPNIFLTGGFAVPGADSTAQIGNAGSLEILEVLK